MHSVKNLKIDSTVGFGAFTITLVLYFHFFIYFCSIVELHYMGSGMGMCLVLIL